MILTLNSPDGFDPVKQGMIFDLKDVLFHNQDFSNKNFFNADFQDVKLLDSKLEDVDLSQVKNLETATLFRSSYNLNARFPKNFVPSEHGMILKLKQADVERGLYDIDLRSADFGDVDLNGIDLQRQHLHGADTRNLKDESPARRSRNRSTVDLSNTLNLERAFLERATYNNRTKFPEGFDPEAHGMILKEGFEF